MCWGSQRSRALPLAGATYHLPRTFFSSREMRDCEAPHLALGCPLFPSSSGPQPALEPGDPAGAQRSGWVRTAVKPFETQVSQAKATAFRTSSISRTIWWVRGKVQPKKRRALVKLGKPKPALHSSTARTSRSQTQEMILPQLPCTRSSAQRLDKYMPRTVV